MRGVPRARVLTEVPRPSTWRAKGFPTPPRRSGRRRPARSSAVDPSGGIDVLLAAVGDGGDVLEAADEAMARFPERSREPVRRLAASASVARGAESPARRLDRDGRRRAARAAPRLPPRGSRRDARTAIGAVALLADRGAIATALESLWSGDPAERADALEVLETTGDHRPRAAAPPAPRGRAPAGPRPRLAGAGAPSSGCGDPQRAPSGPSRRQTRSHEEER